MSTAEIQLALDAAVRSLNAANEAVGYADSAMTKAMVAQAQAAIAVKQLETLVQASWQAEQKGGPRG